MDKKIIILPALMVLFVLIWIFFIFIPKSNQIKELNHHLAELNKKEQQKVSESKIKAIEKDIDNLSKKFHNNVSRFFPEKSLLDLGEYFENIGGRYHLKLNSIMPDYASLHLLKDESQDVTELPVKMEFNGSFLQFARFLDNIPGYPFIIRIQQVSIANIENKYSKLNITLHGIVIIKKEFFYQENVENKQFST